MEAVRIIQEMRQVAPLAGSVDRNSAMAFWRSAVDRSLPSRGAWIEIKRWKGEDLWVRVAPLAGSVDRNL